MATLSDPPVSVSLSTGYVLTAQEIKDMYQKLTISSAASQLQSWSTTTSAKSAAGFATINYDVDERSTLDISIETIQKVLDNRSTILLI